MAKNYQYPPLRLPIAGPDGRVMPVWQDFFTKVLQPTVTKVIVLEEDIEDADQSLVLMHMQPNTGDLLKRIEDLENALQFVDGPKDLTMLQKIDDLEIQIAGGLPGIVNYNIVHSHGYEDRGDAGAWDFTLAGTPLITNANWHDLDLSAIVPEGATAVWLVGDITDNLASQYVGFRKNGNVNVHNAAWIETQVANVQMRYSFTVSCDSDRVIEYYASNTVWTSINILIGGWWK